MIAQKSVTVDPLGEILQGPLALQQTQTDGIGANVAWAAAQFLLQVLLGVALSVIVEVLGLGEHQLSIILPVVITKVAVVYRAIAIHGCKRSPLGIRVSAVASRRRGIHWGRRENFLAQV